MAIRHPPHDYHPRIVRGGRIPPPRVVRYDDRRRVSFARILRFLLKPSVVLPAFCIAVLSVGVLSYYWIIFSARTDSILKGEIFTRAAGIYAEPKQIRAGEPLSQDDLVAYLKRAGYVARGEQGESTRGRYGVNGTTVEIDPSEDAMVDNLRPFDPLRIQFTGSGKSIAAITDKNGGARLDKAQLESELISSVTGHERAKRRVVGFNDLPPDLRKAITTTEDRSFFEHHGVNVRGIIRALLRRYDTDPNSRLAHQAGPRITKKSGDNFFVSP